MLRWRRKIRYIAYILFDLFIILCAQILSRILSNSSLNSLRHYNPLEFLGLFTIVSGLYVPLYYATNTYENTIQTEGQLTKKITIKMLLVNGLCVLILHLISVTHKLNLNLRSIAMLCFIIFISQLISRTIMKYIEFGKNHTIQDKNILIIGASESGEKYVQEMKNNEFLNDHVIGYIQLQEGDVYADLPLLGGLDDLERIVSERVVDELAVVKPLSFDPNLNEKVNLCQCMGITVSMVLDLRNTGMTKADVAMVGQVPVLKFHVVNLNEGQLFLKRLMDVIGAMIGMVIFGLAYLIFAPLIKLESPGPVIFKQDRIGKNGRIFTMLKFRTMVADAEIRKSELLSLNEMNGHIFKIKQDPRVTKIGAFLRKSSIDETPQFLNVLRGDMSLVGTRPPTVDEYREYEANQRCRISITPGLTGIWQISGRSDIKDFDEIIKMDIEYISNWSLLLDFHIMLKTIGVVFSRRGSS